MKTLNTENAQISIMELNKYKHKTKKDAYFKFFEMKLI